jgi:hypothetical protein
MKRRIAWILTALMLCCAVPAFAETADGSGETPWTKLFGQEAFPEAFASFSGSEECAVKGFWVEDVPVEPYRARNDGILREYGICCEKKGFGDGSALSVEYEKMPEDLAMLYGEDHPESIRIGARLILKDDQTWKDKLYLAVKTIAWITENPEFYDWAEDLIGEFEQAVASDAGAKIEGEYAGNGFQAKFSRPTLYSVVIRLKPDTES